ncbi:helix-turn-helix domain-containing protein [Deinococcus deserti]|nr:helix-turn-helix domain-containing protein [Deinococcus deserti]
MDHFSNPCAPALGLRSVSTLKTGKARAIRFSTQDAIYRVLDCLPGDLLK